MALIQFTHKGTDGEPHWDRPTEIASADQSPRAYAVYVAGLSEVISVTVQELARLDDRNVSAAANGYFFDYRGNGYVDFWTPTEAIGSQRIHEPTHRQWLWNPPTRRWQEVSREQGVAVPDVDVPSHWPQERGYTAARPPREERMALIKFIHQGLRPFVGEDWSPATAISHYVTTNTTREAHVRQEALAEQPWDDALWWTVDGLAQMDNTDISAMGRDLFYFYRGDGYVDCHTTVPHETCECHYGALSITETPGDGALRAHGPTRSLWRFNASTKQWDGVKRWFGRDDWTAGPPGGKPPKQLDPERSMPLGADLLCGRRTIVTFCRTSDNREWERFDRSEDSDNGLWWTADKLYEMNTRSPAEGFWAQVLGHGVRSVMRYMDNGCVDLSVSGQPVARLHVGSRTMSAVPQAPVPGIGPEQRQRAMPGPRPPMERML